MSIYLGTPGRMVELKCPSSQQLSMEGDPTFQVTLEGRRVAQVPFSTGRRAWQCQLSDASTPAQIAAAMAFANRDWGPGPFAFVSADAPVTNMLTPAGAASSILATAGVTQGGPVLCSDGTWAAKSLLLNGAPTAYFQSERTPVLPEKPVTVSAEVSGAGARVAVSFFTATGTFIAIVSSPAGGVAGSMRRLSVTADAPATAAVALVAIQNATQATRGVLTWTSEPLEWSDGQGCTKAILHGASRDLVLASRDPRGGRYSNLSFTVTEVG